MSGLNADEEFIPYCYEAVPLRAPNMDGSSSAYAAALKERLGKVRAEVELQAQLAHRLKNDLNEVEDQAQRNQEELALRRQSWAKEQPSREALLHETGEAERSLAARERSCAQALARHVQAEVTRRVPDPVRIARTSFAAVPRGAMFQWRHAEPSGGAWCIGTGGDGRAAVQRKWVSVTALQLLWDREDVDVISFNATLSACERASQWHFALHLLTLFDAKNDELEAIAEQAAKERAFPKADIISYNTSMSACEKGHQWSLALRLYEELQEKALRPDHITYSVALNACQQWTEALELLKRLEEVATSTTDGQTKRSFGAALGVMEKAAQWRSAVALLQRMSELTIGATSQSVALTVSAAERADSWWEALQLFEHFDPNLRLNGHSFTVALRAAEKGRQWSKAVWLLQRMQVARVEPSQHSLSTVLQICWKAKRWREVLKICEDTNYLPTQISDIQALLSSCEQSGRWEFALGLLSIPQLRSIMTQHQMLHLAVSALAGHWEMALSLLNEAAEPDVHAYNALLEAVPHPLKLWILESQLLPSLSPSSSQLHFRRLPVRLGPAGTRRAVRWWLHRWVEPVLRERRKSYKCSISWERRSSGVESQLGALQSGVMQMLKHERLWASEEKGQIELDLTRRDLKTLRWELETLEAKRQELSKGLQELTAAVRQESQLISQLTSKGEALRRETRALRTGTEAAKESEARVWRNMEDLKAAEHAMFQREQLLQRQALDLRELAKRLRAQLEVRPVNGMNEVADQLNRKLEAKVEFLRKELEQEKAKHAAHAAEPFSRSPGGATPGSSHLVGSAGVAGRE
ncbi:Pentatricopeptide repeat-containing protein At5g02860 [Durusdinium trenchii]|uniref:Pentatricopeptide repeat-containing protein At5g02860 n=1 Tax=Durusdinium trenchii TaxID=1381693 RepID=A0ABP0LLP5_9DINO